MNATVVLRWIEKRSVWAQSLLGAALGAFGALAQAPFDHTFMILVMMGLAFVMHGCARSALHALQLGWSLGTGYFVVTLSWIVSPFQVDPTTVWMAPFGLFFMALGMALFWALAFWLAKVLRTGWALIITWTLAEMLRAYVFTGFPWGSPPQALVNVLAGQALAYVGPHGVMLGLCVVAWSSHYALFVATGLKRIGLLLALAAV